MKLQYLSTLALASILSLGMAAGCSNPCAAKTPPTGNPAIKATTDPCAGKANPCAAKADPCAGKANPCAAKSRSVGGPLAAELQGKPVLVDVFAEWCSACKNIAPTLAELEKDYEGQVHFVVLDMTNNATVAEAEAKAEQLGLSQFLAETRAQTGTLTIIDPATGTILEQHRNNPDKSAYTTVLDSALAQN
ncbi:thioredoxin domain-containing protein [Oscillatoria sp. HE19RPO]|uniref:TlpA family protein disulfide reductase n=1 Tax=Oscillatoria sp. HE19RPO TaxID=2954806 RepID=UPI0020C25A1C|nr:thioredoxin domain-containing protein [Oscillatoria sp. HE19RPO]